MNDFVNSIQAWWHRRWYGHHQDIFDNSYELVTRAGADSFIQCDPDICGRGWYFS